MGNQKNKDTGKKAGHGLTAPEMATFWLTKIAEAGNTNTARVLQQWLDPTYIEKDFSCNNQIRLTRQGLHSYFLNDTSMVCKKNMESAQKVHDAGYEGGVVL